ncbi:hypothetical protein WS48_28825 [Burkholderia sp. RF7-non_BP1]|nr:hypothetical protein WS48_28825 [Burkholderia sp. RF7-non_BP1]KUY94212.1 hypothetical protein WS49_24735 [Burkholderia sp. RF7-non_BP4]
MFATPSGVAIRIDAARRREAARPHAPRAAGVANRASARGERSRSKSTSRHGHPTSPFPRKTTPPQRAGREIGNRVPSPMRSRENPHGVYSRGLPTRERMPVRH